MSQTTRVFRAISAASSTIAVTASSAATALPAQTLQYRLYNAGTGTVFFNFGSDSATAAVATATPLPAGNTEVFSVLPNVTHIAAIGDDTATLYVTAGEGM